MTANSDAITDELLQGHSLRFNGHFQVDLG